MLNLDFIKLLNDGKTLELIGFKNLKDLAVFRFSKAGIFIKPELVDSNRVGDPNIALAEISNNRTIVDEDIWKKFKDYGVEECDFYVWNKITNSYLQDNAT